MDPTRRSFLKTSAALAAGLTAARSLLHAGSPETDTTDKSTDKAPATNTLVAAPNDLPLLEGPFPGEQRKGDMIYRPLGSTGQMVSFIGMGGFHLGKIPDEEDAIKLMRSAIDRGITFMDNCWDYNLGTSEVRAGKALRDGYRDKVFLMSKMDGRTKKSAMRQIEESLVRLRTDRIDLVQHHEIIRMEDPDQIFAEEGSMAAFREAKQQGKLRFIGFTGHKDPLIHLRMLQVAEANEFHFDTVQMPINVMDAHFRSFAAQVLPVLVQQKIAPLAMKTFGDSYILETKTCDPIDMLHFSMSLPVSAVITGIDKPAILEQAMQAAKTYKPMTRDQVASLLAKTKVAAAKGATELYKTSWHFDGTAQNPEWLGYEKKQST